MIEWITLEIFKGGNDTISGIKGYGTVIISDCFVNAKGGGGSAGIGGSYSGAGSITKIMAPAVVKAISKNSNVYNGKKAIDAINNVLTSDSTAKVLMANFDTSQSGTAEIKDLSSNIVLSSETNCQSIAVTIPSIESDYTVYIGGIMQYYNNNSTLTNNFSIRYPGLYIFNHLENGPTVSKLASQYGTNLTEGGNLTLSAAVSENKGDTTYEWKKNGESLGIKNSIGTNGVLQGTAKTSALIGTYVLNKGNVQLGETWYAREYAIYKDSNENIFTIYSAIASKTISR